MRYRWICIVILLSSFTLKATECPPDTGVSFINFPGRPHVGKSSFLPSHMSPRELEALQTAYGLHRFDGLSEMLDVYKSLLLQERGGEGQDKIQDGLLLPSYQRFAREFYEHTSVEHLIEHEPSRLLLQSFILPVLLWRIRDLFLPDDRPWLIWDIGAGLGTTGLLTAKMAPERSRLVASDFAIYGDSTENWWPKRVNKLFAEDKVDFHRVRHDAIRESFALPVFQNHPHPGVHGPDFVTALFSLAQYSGEYDFGEFVKHLAAGTRQNTLLVMDVFYRHDAYGGIGHETPGMLLRTHYLKSLKQAGFSPLRELRIEELGYSIFLFGRHANVDEMYERWGARVTDMLHTLVKDARAKRQKPPEDKIDAPPWLELDPASSEGKEVIERLLRYLRTVADNSEKPLHERKRQVNEYLTYFREERDLELPDIPIRRSSSTDDF